MQRNSGEAFVWAVALVISGAALWVGGALLRETARAVSLTPRQIVRGAALILFLAGVGIGLWALHFLDEAVAIAVVLALLGVALWFARTPRGLRAHEFSIGIRELVQGTGLLLSLAGLVVGFRAAVLTADDTEQPAVAVKLNVSDLSLTGTATVANLSSKDRLVVAVDGLVDREDGGYASPDPRGLYEAYLGPDPDGTATHRLDVRIPPGRFAAVGVRAHTAARPRGCGQYPDATGGTSEEETGCVIVRLPPRPQRPQLNASWEGTGRSASSLKLTVDAHDIPAASTGQRVVVRVVGMRKSTQVTLYQTFVAPAASGKLRQEIRLPVEAGFRTVCARES